MNHLVDSTDGYVHIRHPRPPRPHRSIQGATVGNAALPRVGDGRYWNSVVAKRRYEYKPIDDAVYTARYHVLLHHYHPAIAAILAHDTAETTGCEERRIRRR